MMYARSWACSATSNTSVWQPPTVALKDNSLLLQLNLPPSAFASEADPQRQGEREDLVVFAIPAPLRPI